jgi:hypothetical protein
MFDRSTWRTHVGKRLDAFARNPQQDIILGGSTSLLVHLAMCTLEPFLHAFEEEPIRAIQVLSSIIDGPGANMLVKRADALHYQMGRMLDQELRNNADMRADIEALIVAIDTIHIVRQRMHGAREEWFRTTLTQELNTYPESEFVQIRRRLRDRWKSFYDIFRELRQRQGSYTQEDLILLYVGLNDSASNVRAEAARRLGEYAWTPPERLVAKLLHVALYDRDLETRNAAARALGSLRDRIASPHLLDSLIRHMESQDRFVRSATALLLAELGEFAGTTSLVDKLVSLLKDADHYTREAAACALGRMGPAAVTSEVMQALTEALQDVNEDVHGASLDSLTQLRELRSVMLEQTTRPASGGQQNTPGAARQQPQPPTQPGRNDAPAQPPDDDNDGDAAREESSSSQPSAHAAHQNTAERPRDSRDASLVQVELGRARPA